MEPLTVMMALILVLAAGAALWWIARRQGRKPGGNTLSGDAGPIPDDAHRQPPAPPAVADHEVAIHTSSEELGCISPAKEPEYRTWVERQDHIAAAAPADSSASGYLPLTLLDGWCVQGTRASQDTDTPKVTVNGQSPGPSMTDSSTGDGEVADLIVAEVAAVHGEVKVTADSLSDEPRAAALEISVGTDLTEAVNDAEAGAFLVDLVKKPIHPPSPSVPPSPVVEDSLAEAAPADVENEELGSATAECKVQTADLGPAEVAGSGVEGLGPSSEFRSKQYKPPRRPGVPKPQRDGSRSERTTSYHRDRTLLIDVRIRPERGGFCTVSLLARRTGDLPDIVTISTSGGLGELTALQDEWYLDVTPPGIGQLLRSGTVWESQDTTGSTTRWSLSGRDLYVLAPHERMSGHLAVTRLELGEDHVVLCTRERLNEVQEAIRATGSPEGTPLDWTGDETGMWVVLASVRPERAVPLRGPADTLDALCPLPDARIALQGGIRLGRQAWLCGFPPAIRIVGDSSATGVVHIDQHPAVRGAGGAYEAPGWDRPGEHIVSCEAGTKSYQIASGLEKWEAWDAYTWSVGDLSTQEGVRPAICGMLVRPPQNGPRDGRHYTGPVANPVLLGAVPGQVYSCEGRLDLRSGVCRGYPPFEPVWALPANPLHCDKSISRILKVGSQPPIPTDTARLSRKQAVQLRAWVLTILEASRKGLCAEPGDDETASLWASFRKEARATWRSMR